MKLDADKLLLTKKNYLTARLSHNAADVSLRYNASLEPYNCSLKPNVVVLDVV